MEPPTYRKVVGLNVQRARKSIEGLTQEDLGKRLAGALGLAKPVLKATISAIEVGDRDVSTDELIAIAIILRRSVPDLLLPHQESEVILGSQRVPTDELRRWISPMSTETTEELRQIMEKLLEAGLAQRVSSVTSHPDGTVGYDEEDNTR